MGEITLTDAQILQATRILWNYGQYHTTRTRGEQSDVAMPYQLTCDEDDVHEYLVEAGMLKANTDESQWLSDESLNQLFDVKVHPGFIFTTS